MRQMRSLSCLLVVALMASACGSSSPATATTPTTVFAQAILFTGAEFLAPGQAGQLTATERSTTGTTKDVTTIAVWTSSNTGVAQVSSTGLVTAVAIGEATITATDAGTTGTWVVSVTAATVTSLLVAGPGSLSSTQTSQMSAVASLVGGSTQVVTTAAAWQSSNPRVATVDGSGLLTAVAPGTTTITATYMGLAGTWVVTVNDTVTSVVVFGAASLVATTAQTSQFSAAAVMSSGPEQIVTSAAFWASSNPAAATVSGTGLVTAVAAGTTTITATYNGVTGSAAVSVN
jgi:uncharacterized protein YjdB